MKIYAESQIIEVPSYMHVGYLATTSIRPNSSVLLVSLFIFVLAIISFVKYSTVKVRKVRVVKLSKDFKTWVLFFGLVALGYLIFDFSYSQYGKKVYDHPQSLTKSSLQYLFVSLYNNQIYKLKHNKKYSSPTDIDEVREMLDLPFEVITDGWFNRIKIKKETIKGVELYSFISAGEDSIFDTDDDYVYPGEENQGRYIPVLQKYTLENEHLSEKQNQTQKADK